MSHLINEGDDSNERGGCVGFKKASRNVLFPESKSPPLLILDRHREFNLEIPVTSSLALILG